MKSRGNILNTKDLSPAQRLAIIAGAGTLVFGACAPKTEAEAPVSQPTSISQEEPKQETAPEEVFQEQPSASLMDFKPSDKIVELTGIESTQQALDILKEGAEQQLKYGLVIETNAYDFWKQVASGDISPLVSAQVSSTYLQYLAEYSIQIAGAKEILNGIPESGMQQLDRNLPEFRLLVDRISANTFLLNQLNDSGLAKELDVDVDIKCRDYEFDDSAVANPELTKDAYNNLFWYWGLIGTRTSPVIAECYPRYKGTNLEFLAKSPDEYKAEKEPLINLYISYIKNAYRSGEPTYQETETYRQYLSIIF